MRTFTKLSFHEYTKTHRWYDNAVTTLFLSNNMNIILIIILVVNNVDENAKYLRRAEHGGTGPLEQTWQTQSIFLLVIYNVKSK